MGGLLAGRRSARERRSHDRNPMVTVRSPEHRRLQGKDGPEMRTVAIVGVGVLLALCVARHDDLLAAAGAVPPATLAGLAALHLLGLVARSEAWRLSLAAIAGAPPSRVVVHTANAGAFVVGSLEAHATMPARIALLRRLAPTEAPHPGHVAVADLPILLIEVAVAALLLGMTGEWWAPVAAVAALVVARAAAGRKATRGLAVLADARRRAALTGIVAFIVSCGLARIWVALSVVQLDASPARVAVAFAALGAFGLLPLGPSAPPGALLLVSGGAGALAAGLVLSATSIAAVLLYAGLLALVGDRAKARRQPVQLEGPEAVEERMGGAVEVGRARGEQAELGAACRDPRRLLGAVGGIERLDAVEAERGEVLDPLGDDGGIVDVPERVRPDGDAAGLVHDLDRLGHVRRRAPTERGRARYEIGLEELRGVHDLLALEAHPVGGMVESSLSEVRPADRRALRQVELQTTVAQRLGHADGTGRPVGAEGGQRTEQRDGSVVDEVAEDVEVLEVPVGGRELDRRHEAEAKSSARLHRLVDAVHRVMVGERKQLDARVRRRRHDGARR
jgi:hypothetical protein